MIEQLAALMDKIGMKEKIKEEIERHKRFNVGILGLKEASVKVADVDIRNYAKHVLRGESLIENRELSSCLRSKVIMNNKIVRVVGQA